MTFEELLQKREKTGREEGRTEGFEQKQEEMLRLIRCMTDDGKSDQISRLASDPAFFQKMYENYITLKS